MDVRCQPTQPPRLNQQSRSALPHRAAASHRQSTATRPTVEPQSTAPRTTIEPPSNPTRRVDRHPVISRPTPAPICDPRAATPTQATRAPHHQSPTPTRRAPWRTRQRALARPLAANAHKSLLRTTLTTKRAQTRPSRFENRFFRKSLFCVALSRILAIRVQQLELPVTHFISNT